MALLVYVRPNNNRSGSLGVKPAYSYSMAEGTCWMRLEERTDVVVVVGDVMVDLLRLV